MNRSWVKFLPRLLRRKLDSRHGLQGIIGNSGWLFADKLFRLGIGLILGLWIARYLGPEEYGLLSYSIAFVSLFATLATLGLDAIVVRELTVRPDEKDVILGSTFGLKLAGGILAYAVVLGAIALVKPASSETAILVAIIAAGLVFQSCDAADFWFQSQVQAKNIVIARNSAFTVVASVKVWLLLNEANLYAFAWAGLFEVVLAGCALIIAFRVKGNSLTALRFEWPVARRLLEDSWPLAVSGMFVLMTMQLDRILLGEIADISEVGLYSIASQMSSIWYMVPMIVGASIAPSIVRSYVAGDSNYGARLQRVYTTLTYIAVGTAVVVFFFSGPIISYLLGPEYQGSAPILSVHIWGGIFVFHVSIRTRALIAEGKQRFVTRIAGLTMLSSIILNIVLIREFNGLGAAYASLISWALCAMLFPAIWPETRQSVAMFFRSFKALGWK